MSSRARNGRKLLRLVLLDSGSICSTLDAANVLVGTLIHWKIVGGGFKYFKLYTVSYFSHRREGLCSPSREVVRDC
jgi:hypothetical protein